MYRVSWRCRAAVDPAISWFSRSVSTSPETAPSQMEDAPLMLPVLIQVITTSRCSSNEVTDVISRFASFHSLVQSCNNIISQTVYEKPNDMLVASTDWRRWSETHSSLSGKLKLLIILRSPVLIGIRKPLQVCWRIVYSGCILHYSQHTHQRLCHISTSCYTVRLLMRECVSLFLIW